MGRASKSTRRERRRSEAKPAAAPVPAAVAAQDEVMAALGFDTQAYLADEERATRDALAAADPIAALSAAMARAAASAEGLLKTILEVLPPDPPVACGEGCAHCCFLRAEVSAPEVLRIAAYLRATLSPERFEALRRHVRETAERIGNWDVDRRAQARVPCSLLADGRCMVYEVRPFVCRASNSADPIACERALVDADATKVVYAPQKALFRYAGTATARALTARGLSAQLFELNAALAIALSTPDAGERWLAGELTFTAPEVKT